MTQNLRWWILLGAAAVALFGLIFWIGRQIPEPMAEDPAAEVELLEEETSPLEAAALATPDPCVDESTGLGGIAVEGWIGRPVTPNPVLADRNPVDSGLVSLIYRGLTRIDADGLPVPDLAESWTISEDGLTVTFQLDSTARWHDGQPFTSADVAATYALLQDPAIAGQLTDGAIWSQVTINPIDPQQIQFTLVEPYAPFLVATTRGILPAHLLQGATAAELATHPINRQPVGTGPFVVQNDWTQDGFVLLVPDLSQWEQEIGLDALQIRFFADDGGRIDPFSAGTVHLLPDVGTAAIQDVLALDGASVTAFNGGSYAQLLFQVGATLPDEQKPVTADVNVRRGLALALDRVALADESLSGQAIPFAEPFPPTSWAYQPVPALVRIDIVSATAALDAAGWLPSGENGQGVRTQNEQPLRLRFVALERPDTQAVARQIIRQWQAVGVEVVLETVPAAAWLQTLAEGNYDVALVEFATPTDPDLYDFWSQEAIIRGQNYSEWNNRRASEALEAGRQVWNPAERLDYYRVFQQFFVEDLPAVSLYQNVSNIAVNARIEGVDVGPALTPIDRYRSFPNWRIEGQTAECLTE